MYELTLPALLNVRNLDLTNAFCNALFLKLYPLVANMVCTSENPFSVLKKPSFHKSSTAAGALVTGMGKVKEAKA